MNPRSNIRIRGVLFLCLAAILAGCTATASGPVPLEIAAGEQRQGDLRIINGQAILGEGAGLDGTVYLVLGGLTLEPQATISEDVVILNGTLQMEPGASIQGDVVMLSGRAGLKEGAGVAGEVTSDRARFFQELTARLVQQLILLCCLPVLGLAVVGLGIWIVHRRRAARRAPSEIGGQPG
jgi:hypothetical protein